MNEKTQGAWIVHHAHKLNSVAIATQDYEKIKYAGKCGIVLSSLANSEKTEISKARFETLAKANGISTILELPIIKKELERQRLIEITDKGISILGLTPNQTLEYTNRIFEEASPCDNERAVIEVAEKASHLPIIREEAEEYISDTIHISKEETIEILKQGEEIGFYDSEIISGHSIYFNGNLFRRRDIRKISNIVAAFNSEEERRIIEITDKLKKSGCLPKEEVKRILGDSLYSQLCAIGLIDENAIGNEKGIYSFVTRPSAFTKYTDSIVDDAFDLAKAMVTSLTYGMTSSPSNRGRIRMVEALMNKLIAGIWVGPATAIGQDYKVLEIKGVIEVKPIKGGLFTMRLLKRAVGELALSVITEGEACTVQALGIPSVSATRYIGPEVNRTVIRKKQTEPLKRSVAKILDDLRTGGK